MSRAAPPKFHCKYSYQSFSKWDEYWPELTPPTDMPDYGRDQKVSMAANRNPVPMATLESGCSRWWGELPWRQGTTHWRAPPQLPLTPATPHWRRGLDSGADWMVSGRWGLFTRTQLTCAIFQVLNRVQTEHNTLVWVTEGWRQWCHYNGGSAVWHLLLTKPSNKEMVGVVVLIKCIHILRSLCFKC